MPLLVPGEIPGLEIRRVQSFAGKALYGHINGGADLYHEYGFERLSVQDLRLNDVTYFTEVYRMNDPAGAFGIFSVSHGECAPADSLPRSSCASPHAIQWAQSRYFVRVASESGSPDAQAGGLRLARRLSTKIPGDYWTIPPVPAAAGGTERTLLSRPRHPGDAERVRPVESARGGTGELRGGDRLPGRTPPGRLSWESSRFATDADLERFSRAFSGRGKLVRSFQKSERRLLVMESDAPADSLWSNS